MRSVVIGVGKRGLAVAVQFANKGHDVVGVDIDASVVENVNAGREPFPGEAELAGRLSACVTAGRLRASTSCADAVPDADAVVVVVPLVVDEACNPKFAGIDAATRTVGEHLTEDTLGIYQTALPAGTTLTHWTPEP